MIHEYAIAPSVLACWAKNSRDYREFLREYGLGSPRILSSFPKAKATKLRGYLLALGPQDQDSIQGQRYLEMINIISEALVERPVLENVSDNWEEMMMNEHEHKPFNVIITNPKMDVDKGVSPSCMYDFGSIWSHVRQASIQRQAAPVVELLRNFLRYSTKQVVIIDPFGWTNEACVAIRELLRTIDQNRVNTKIPTVHLYYKRNNQNSSPLALHVKQKIMAGLILENFELQVSELKEIVGDDVFHNRCVLTEHGGALSGHGFSLSGEDAHTDDWFLLTRDIYEKKWQQFVEDCRFDIASQA